MIIKKHTSPTLLSWFNTHFLASNLAYFVGMVGLLLLLLLFSSTQNRVSFSPQGHFFAEPSEVKLNSSNMLANHSIKYTLDGSEPTKDSPTYHEPLTLQHTTTIRAALFDQDKRVGNIYNHPVFINVSHQLPIINIVTNQENFFDSETGIYVQKDEKGEEWERPAHLTFFEPDGTLGFQKDIGIRIHGGGSRSHAQKSLRVYAGYLDHTQQIRYPIFPELEYSTFNSFLLRAGGGDWEYAFIRDAVMQTLANNLTELDAQAVRPAVVYLNNQYWGVYFIQERIDQYYLANKYGLSKDKLSIVAIPHDTGPKRGKVVSNYGSNKAVTEYNELYEKAASTCVGCTNYSDFSPSMDTSNFRDYMILQTFSGNFDWPFGNVKLWRYEQPTKANEDEKSSIDGRFRWIFFDLDTGLGFTKLTEEEMIKSAQNRVYNQLDDTGFPFLNLFYNEKFRQEYLTRTAELLNTTLTSEAIIEVIDSLSQQIAPEMPAHIARWKGQSDEGATEVVSSVEEWQHQVELLRVFARYRPQKMFEDSAEVYQRSKLAHVTLKSVPNEAGDISVGTIYKEESELPWQGTFFNGTAMAFEAHPNPGYIFDHWEGNVPQGGKYSSRVVIPFNNQKEVIAVFRKRLWYEYLISKDWGSKPSALFGLDSSVDSESTALSRQAVKNSLQL